MRRILFFSGLVELILLLIVALCFSGLAVVVAVREFDEEELFRFFIGHVSYAWLSSALYVVVALLAAFQLVGVFAVFIQWLYDALLRILFLVLGASMFTGYIWSQHSWGHVVLDFRILSQLLLLLATWVALVLVTRRTGQLVILAGLASLPVLKYSVNWWNTMHQAATVVAGNESTIAASIIYCNAMYLLFALLVAAEVCRAYIRTVWVKLRIGDQFN